MYRLLMRNRWTTALFVALIMLATSGVSLSRMTCLLGGHSTLAIGSLADHCPEEPAGDGPEFRPVCCAFTEAGGDRAVTVVHTALELDVALEHVVDAPAPPAVGTSKAAASRVANSLPPPLALAERLARIGAYLI